jgi:hypothetical protein
MAQGSESDLQMTGDNAKGMIDGVLSEEEHDRQIQEYNDLVTVMSTRQGRRLIWRLISECELYVAAPIDNHPRMAFQEGKREIGRRLLVRAQTVPELFLLMQSENQQPRG